MLLIAFSPILILTPSCATKAQLVIHIFWTFVLDTDSTMRCHRLSVLPAAPLCYFATPLASIWEDIRVMHMWNATPVDWETIGWLMSQADTLLRRNNFFYI